MVMKEKIKSVISELEDEIEFLKKVQKKSVPADINFHWRMGKINGLRVAIEKLEKLLKEI